MKIGRISRFLMFASASLFLHAAALSVVRHFIPRGRAPATEISREGIHPIELFSPRTELAHPTFRPRVIIPEIIPVSGSEPVKQPVENTLIPVRRRSASRLENVEPAPSPSEPAEAPPAAPILVEAPTEASPVTMPVGYFLAHPGGLATEPASQEVIRGVALDSMRQAELTPVPATPAPQQPERSEDQREQLLSEGCWVVQNGTGSIQCPSWHPSNRPIPVYQETEDGFIVGMHDPSEISRSGPERRYHFQRQADGSYLYQDPDGRNWIRILPDGRMEDSTDAVSRPEDHGLIYQVFDLFSGALPWDRPAIPHYMWREVEDSTREVRLQIAEQYDRSVTRETLDGLSLELSQIIERHTEWSVMQQHDFLFRRWDECREDTVGNEARTTIEEFIRQHYRQGGRLQFTEEEIRGFNERRRTESESFCPYGCLPDMVLQEPQVGDSL